MTPSAMQALLAKIKASRAAAGDAASVVAADKISAAIEQQKPAEVDVSNLGKTVEEVEETVSSIVAEPVVSSSTSREIGVAKAVTLNEKQQLFLDTVLTGVDISLIGAAGTGKTTTMRQTTRALIDGGYLPRLHKGTKHLTTGSPGMVIVSYTNKAVNNIRHAVVNELKSNTITLHKLLEFAPIFYDAEDKNNPGTFKKTMRFEPSYNKLNPLPSTIRIVAFEESSMIGLDLYNQFLDAMQHPHQEIFLGDIQQLPPVFGPAILGFKLNELVTVELTEIYRQAANSPIIDLAWNLLSGNASNFSAKSIVVREPHPITGKIVDRKKWPALDAFSRKTENGEVTFQPWQKKLSEEHALGALIGSLKAWWKTGYYDPKENIILCPFNVNFGCDEINRYIAQFLGDAREAVVHHVIAGYNNHYLAEGDRVLFAKEDAYIVSIRRNGEYLGKAPNPPSIHLDRWGHYQEKLTQAEEYLHKQDTQNLSDEALDRLMAAAAVEAEDRVNAASHVVEIRFAYGDENDNNTYTLSTASEINALLGGYAITVHKSQGSEYNKVFLALHSTHATMVSRELLYTAVTRAKTSLHIICEPESFYRGIQSQRIIGNSLKEKAAIFRGKALSLGDIVPVSKNTVPGLLPVPRNPYYPARTATPAEIAVPELYDAWEDHIEQEAEIIDYTLLIPVEEVQEPEEAPGLIITDRAETLSPTMQRLKAMLVSRRK